MDKSIKELAAELGQSMKEEKAAVETQAQKEARQREEAAQRGRDREAAFITIFDKAKESLIEAHEVLKTFSDKPDHSLRVYDGRAMISTRQTRPGEVSHYTFEVYPLKGDRTVEDFVAVIVPIYRISDKWNGAFAREITNFKQVRDGAQSRRPVRAEYGNNIIACVHKSTAETTVVLDERDPLSISDVPAWVKQQVGRMLVELRK